LKIFGLALGVAALLLSLVGVGASHRHPGVITASQYASVRVGQVDRNGVLLYFGTPAQPEVHVAPIELAATTEARTPCLTYLAQTEGRGYRFCFAPGTQTMTSKQEVAP
jgi:hypothetical protein